MKFPVFSAEVTRLEVDLDRCPHCNAVFGPAVLARLQVTDGLVDEETGRHKAKHLYPQQVACRRCARVVAEGTLTIRDVSAEEVALEPLRPVPVLASNPLDERTPDYHELAGMYRELWAHAIAMQERIGELEGVRDSMGERLAEWREGYRAFYPGGEETADPAQALRDLAEELRSAQEWAEGLRDGLRNLSRAARNLALATPDVRLRAELERAVALGNRLAGAVGEGEQPAAASQGAPPPADFAGRSGTGGRQP